MPISFDDTMELINQIDNMSKDVKQPDPKDIEDAKAIKDAVVKTNQIVKK